MRPLQDRGASLGIYQGRHLLPRPLMPLPPDPGACCSRRECDGDFFNFLHTALHRTMLVSPSGFSHLVSSATSPSPTNRMRGRGRGTHHQAIFHASHTIATFRRSARASCPFTQDTLDQKKLNALCKPTPHHSLTKQSPLMMHLGSAIDGTKK